MHFNWKLALTGVVLAIAVLMLSDIAVLHVLRGRATDFDESVRLAVHSTASPPLTLAMRFLTWLGAAVTLIPLTFGLAGVLRRMGFRERALLPVIALGMAEGLTETAKFLARRPRPVPWFGIAPESWSFPSGHSLDSMVCFLASGAALLPLIASRLARVLVMTICGSAALLIGITRIYLGVHWPTDVLTGWVAGACAAGGLIRASRGVE